MDCLPLESPNGKQPQSKSKCSPTDWFEVYYSYLEGCKNFNEFYDSPEQGWEWNHTLPQCLFGDQPLGQWLTPYQHAIATALQTLAFDHCCLFGSHLALLPKSLHKIVLPIYQNRARKQGKINAQFGHLDRIRELRDPEILKKIGKQRGRLNVESGLWASLKTVEHQSQAGRKGAQTTHSQRWMCTVTGKISTPGGLSSWQNARGIPTHNRIKISEEV